MDEVIGRRIDDVTIAMVETLLKEYKAIEDKYDKLKNDSLTKSRHTLLKTLSSIPKEQRTDAESEMFLYLLNTNIAEIGTKEDKVAELMHKDHEEILKFAKDEDE